jgi:TonB family protein
MKPQTLSVSVLASAIFLCAALAACATPVFAQSAAESSGTSPAPTQTGPSPRQPTTNSAPTAVHSDEGPHTCDSYLPAGFVFPPTAQTTLISYHVGPAGKLSDVSLYRSSGNSDLDKAALACVSGQHEESTEAAGKPIEATWIGGVFWGSGFHSFGLSSPSGQPNLCPNYPRIAVRMNQEGTATVTFQIATDGSVKDVALAKSTGYPVLDKATLDCVAAYRYFPVMQNGQPITIDKTVSIAWRLMETPPGPVVQIAVAEGGGLLIEGQRFSDTYDLKGKLFEIRSRNPPPYLCMIVTGGGNASDFKALSQALGMLKDAGVRGIRLCNAPLSKVTH